MLNDWESALADNTSKDLFSNKFEEEICRSSKTKTKSKDVFESIASSNRPISWGPLAQMRWQGVAKENLPLASKILTSPLVRNLSLPTAKNLPALRDLPQVHPLEISLFPQGLLCRYPLAGRLKYFRKNWEKLSSDQVVLNMISDYKVPFSEVPYQRKYPSQVPTSREKSVSGNKNPGTLRKRGNQNDRFASG